MTKIRKTAFSLLEEVPEDKLVFLIQIMEGIAGLQGKDVTEREEAFLTLERLRKKEPVNLDYKTELASYRVEKYGNACID